MSGTSTRKEQSGFEAEPEILVEPRPQAGLPLRRAQVVERAHFALVVGAAPDHAGAGLVELAVGRMAVAQRREKRHEPVNLLRALRLTRVSGRRLRLQREVAVAHVAGLAALGDHRSTPFHL